MEDCEIWPGRALQAVFAQHLARLGRPPTMDELLNFGFEDELRHFFEANSSIVRDQALKMALLRKRLANSSHASLTANPSLILQIPVLNDRPLARLPRSCLVRVRAMVQSVADPEYYHLVYEEHQSQRRIVRTVHRSCGLLHSSL